MATRLVALLGLLSAILIHGLYAAKDFKTQCEQLTGVTASFYAFHNCFVLPTSTARCTHYATQCNDFSRGGLLVMSTQTISDYISAVLLDLGLSDYYCIGAKQANKTDEPAGNWEWLVGTKKYAMDIPTDWWLTNQPNNYNNKDQCMAIKAPDGTFNDVSCTTARLHVCQYEHPTNRRSFKRAFIGKKGNPGTVIADWSGLGGNTQSECSLKCAAESFCFSYSIDKNNDKCYIHWDDAKFSHQPPVIDTVTSCL